MRDTTIDIMRVIGIMLIILAHVSPPEFLFQLRTFDVPMMIFISGMSYYVASKKDVKIVPYVKSRFRRLVVPAWIFITLFYITIYVFNPEKFYDIKKTSINIKLSSKWIWLFLDNKNFFDNRNYFPSFSLCDGK